MRAVPLPDVRTQPRRADHAQPGRAGHAVRDLIERNRARPVARPLRRRVCLSPPVRRALLATRRNRAPVRNRARRADHAQPGRAGHAVRVLIERNQGAPVTPSACPPSRRVNRCRSLVGASVRLDRRNRAPCASMFAAFASVRPARPVARPLRRRVCLSRPVRRALLCRPWRVPRGAPSACPLPISTGNAPPVTRNRARRPPVAPSACALPISTGNRARLVGLCGAPSRCRMFEHNRAPCRSRATRARRSRRPGSHRAQPCAARRPVRSSLRAPCAACVASAPCVRRMVAACSPRAPVPSVARPSRQATRRRSRATVRAVRRSRRRPVHRQGA